MSGKRPIEQRRIVIVGGGLAGVSLALKLVQKSVDADIRIIEPSTRLAREQTWCFWDVEDHQFSHLVEQTWPAFSFRGPSGPARWLTPSYPYCRISAQKLYEYAFRQLSKYPNVALDFGESVWSVLGKTIVTDQRTLHADLVFDGRPMTGSDCNEPARRQQFVGRYIRVQRPGFPPDALTLMDFRVPQELGVSFVYVLPLSEIEALVEFTVFTDTIRRTADIESLLDTVLQRRVGAYETVTTERGWIPMDPAYGIDRDPQGVVVPIGTRAGAPRPATGYAFLAIQRDSDALAEAVADGRPLPDQLRSPVITWLDRVFLDRMRNAPRRSAWDFERMFENVPADRLVRFLMETESWADRLAVMNALPTFPYIGQAARTTRPRLFA